MANGTQTRDLGFSPFTAVRGVADFIYNLGPQGRREREERKRQLAILQAEQDKIDEERQYQQSLKDKEQRQEINAIEEFNRAYGDATSSGPRQRLRASPSAFQMFDTENIPRIESGFLGKPNEFVDENMLEQIRSNVPQLQPLPTPQQQADVFNQRQEMEDIASPLPEIITEPNRQLSATTLSNLPDFLVRQYFENPPGREQANTAATIAALNEMEGGNIRSRTSTGQRLPIGDGLPPEISQVPKVPNVPVLSPDIGALTQQTSTGQPAPTGERPLSPPIEVDTRQPMSTEIALPDFNVAETTRLAEQVFSIPPDLQRFLDNPDSVRGLGPEEQKEIIDRLNNITKKRDEFVGNSFNTNMTENIKLYREIAAKTFQAGINRRAAENKADLDRETEKLKQQGATDAQIAKEQREQKRAQEAADGERQEEHREDVAGLTAIDRGETVTGEDYLSILTPESLAVIGGFSGRNYEGQPVFDFFQTVVNLVAGDSSIDNTLRKNFGQQAQVLGVGEFKAANGAIGPITEQEWAKLAASITNLNFGDAPAFVAENIVRFIFERRAGLDLANQQFAERYGDYYSGLGERTRAVEILAAVDESLQGEDREAFQEAMQMDFGDNDELEYHDYIAAMRTLTPEQQKQISDALTRRAQGMRRGGRPSDSNLQKLLVSG